MGGRFFQITASVGGEDTEVRGRVLVEGSNAYVDEVEVEIDGVWSDPDEVDVSPRERDRIEDALAQAAFEGDD